MEQRPRRQDHRVGDSTPAPTAEQPAPAIDPARYAREDLCQILAALDIGGLYRALKDDPGLSQRQIAARTGQSQSEVADIVVGRRQVENYHLLVRIAEGLDIPRERMGLSWWGPDGTYCGLDTVAKPLEVVSAEMLRRHLIALGGVAMVGATVVKLGELLAELPGPPTVPLPSRLDHFHVTQVRDLTRRLGEADNSCVCNAEVISAAAGWAARLLDVSGPEPVTRALMSAVAELHIEAGWSAFDAGLYHRALYHYARVLELAIKTGDAYLQALALSYVGTAAVEHGHPDDGLKMLQIGQVRAWEIPPDERRAVVVGENGRTAVEATALAESATARADLGCLDAAEADLVTARQLWMPTRCDPYGDLDRPTASLALRRGRLDLAESLAAASVLRWEGGRQISRAQSGVLLATIYVRAGESRGLRLAHDAITAVTKLSSVRVRRQLLPLAQELQARRGSDYAELSRQARQVAAARA